MTRRIGYGERPFHAGLRTFATVAAAILLLAGVALLPRAAAAEPATLSRTDVVRVLGERYAETPVALGLAQNGGVIEVFATKDGSTWTMVLTMPDGLSTVIAAGENWTPLTPLPGQPA